MSLDQYVEKRHLDQTPEPIGGEPSAGLPSFVVQLHRATRLHYDFRLEADGVLKSWAVPKGPSQNPADKRLAMMVEDHPLDYRAFEGIIPKGNYGAGTVMVWDQGTYATPGATSREDIEHEVKVGLHKGHVAVFLSGQKLRGLFDIIHLKGREENAWLLVKRQDEFASEESGLDRDRSVQSGRTLEEIKAGAPAAGEVWYSDRLPERFAIDDAPRGEMPRGVRPMLATEVDAPFDREGWLFEVKWDGYRAIAEVEAAGDVRLYSRNQLSFEANYPAIVSQLKLLGHAAVLDGEIVVVDEEGRSHFQWLQDYQKGHRGTLLYYVFDLLYLGGHGGLVRLSDHVEDRGCAFFEAVSRQQLEGMLAKDGASPYRPGRRTSEWLKVKRLLRTAAVVGGFTEPRNSRKHFGALVLGVYDGDHLLYVGHTGGGFDEPTLAGLIERLQPLKTETCPFKEVPKTNMPVTWVEPRIVCQVAFRQWTESGILRQPVFEHVCPDLDPRTVHREERVEPPPEQAARQFPVRTKAESLTVGGHRLQLTNLDKVFWPEEGLTKGDLISYYRDIAPFILPYLKDRPESLHRHPNGITQKGFFQKDMPKETPDWIETCSIHSPSHGKNVRYLLCQEEATLIYLANLACIEINPWNSRTESLDRPDYIVIDLDPLDVTFTTVVEAAVVVRRVLDQLEVPSYPKTSGSKGIHIYVPMGARYGYDQGKQFAELIAGLVHAQLPATTSVERMPARRRGRVYLDFLQNRDGQTLAAPYSARPKPGATVSTPLRWDEVTPSLDPRTFDIRSIFDRLDSIGDIWGPVLKDGIDLIPVLQRVQERFG